MCVLTDNALRSVKPASSDFAAVIRTGFLIIMYPGKETQPDFSIYARNPLSALHAVLSSMFCMSGQAQLIAARE